MDRGAVAARSAELARLLARRVEAADQPPDGEVSVAELRRRLVPYEVARADLALASKAEYDLAMLHLLASEEHLESEDRDLIRDARSELDSPEPGLGFLQDYAASHLQLRLGDLARESADSAAARRATAEGGELAGPRPGSEPGSGSERGRAPAVDGTGDSGGRTDDGPAADGPAGAEAEACWSCDRELPSPAGEARFCVWCGADLTVRPCDECGTELQSDWRFCPSCGQEAAE